MRRLSCFTACGERKQSHKSSRSHPQSTCTNGKEILTSVTNIGSSLYCQLYEDTAKILLNLLNEHLDQTGLLPGSQCGFRKDRDTIDTVFTARQLQEKCQEQNVDLYMTFVDLTKAFDKVSRDGRLKIMSKFGCPVKFIAIRWHAVQKVAS